MASSNVDDAKVRQFLQSLNAEVQDFNSVESRENGKDIAFIKKTLQYPEEDIVACQWLHLQTKTLAEIMPR